MPQSFVKSYTHIIFSTKNRHPYIKDEIENKLYNYVAGILKQYDTIPIKVGGHKDHIHIFCLPDKNRTIPNLVREIKARSSRWMKDQFDPGFAWQRGYGAFSSGPENIQTIVQYIENQHHHHKKITFQDEFRAILNKYNIEYDDRYIWD